KERIDVSGRHHVGMIADKADGMHRFARGEANETADRVEDAIVVLKNVKTIRGSAAPAGSGGDAEVSSVLVHRELVQHLAGHDAGGGKRDAWAVELGLHDV